MKSGISRRASLKAIAASAVAGGAWIAGLAIPEVTAFAKRPVPPRGAKLTLGKLTGADLKAAINTFMASSEGQALHAQFSNLGLKPAIDLATAGWFEYAGERRVSVNIPYGSGDSQIGGVGLDLSAPDKAGASFVERLSADKIRITSYAAPSGSPVATHVLLGDRGQRRLHITEIATGKTRVVTHDEVWRAINALEQQQPADGALAVDYCAICVWIAGAIASIGACGGMAWLTCFVFFWDPPLAGACATFVGVFGGWVMTTICWALGWGLGAQYGCYEIGACSCPYWFGC